MLTIHDNHACSMTKDCYLKSSSLSPSSLWLYISSILSIAIVCSGLPARAEAKFPVLRDSQTAKIEHSSLPNTVPNPVLNPVSEKPIHSPNLKQADSAADTPLAKQAESGDSAELDIPLDSTTPNQEATSFDVSIESTDLEPIAVYRAETVAQAEPTAQSDETLPVSESDNRWQFSVEPYLFVPLDIEADVTVAGRRTSIDLGLDDILNLDRAFDAGLRLEAQHDRWGFILDGFYLFGSDSGGLGGSFAAENLLQFVQRTSPQRVEQFVQRFDSARLQQFLVQRLGPERLQQIIGEQQFGLNTPVRVTANGRATVRQITIDAAISYRLVDTVLNDSTNSSEVSNFYPRLVIAPILGVRTNSLRQTVEIDTVRIDNVSIPENRLPSIDREFRFSRTLVEPMIGAEFGLSLSDRWALNLRGDVSGFDIGADRNLTWNLLAAAQYRISRLASLQLGYRFNSFVFQDGDGFRRTRVDLNQDGLWLSTVFQF